MPRILRRLWSWPHELRERGVLGMNCRNGCFCFVENKRRHYPRVDDKLQTKQLCEANGIRVPRTYALIERYGDVRSFPECLGSQQEFVIKPARGAEGRGILVIARRDGHQFVTSSGGNFSVPDLRYHLSAVLSGLFSLGSQPDRAIIEQRVQRHSVFERVAVDGTPDVRVILYRCVPVMAMVRLPTHISRGRANLHQGAVGVAVALNTGLTFGGVWKSRPVCSHPDTGVSIRGLKIPHWDGLLIAAMKLADAMELGYIGVDFVLDATDGPVVLEANARPGLAVQIANERGLLPRLTRVADLVSERPTLEHRKELISILADDL